MAGAPPRRRPGAGARAPLLEGYGGGIFLAFADATSGTHTYCGGRCVLDSVKGAGLGMDGERRVLDFNFSYNPSCADDARWICPLAPPANRLAVEIRGGELTPSGRLS